MEIVVLQVFVSLMLVVGSIVLFWFTCQQRDFDHADRLALLPIEDETSIPPVSGRTAFEETDGGASWLRR